MYLLSLLLVLALPVSVQDGLSQDVDNAINDLVSEQHSESQNARAELVEIGRKASPQLVLALQAENASVQQRHMICEILGKIRDNNPAVIAALTKALEDREEFGTSVASVAASALAWIGDEKAVPALIQVMGSKGEDGTLRVDLDLQLKYEIIRALGILRAAGAVESLRTSLKDMKTTQLGPEDEWAHLIAAAAAEALGYIRANSAIEDLGALLGNGTIDPFSEKPLQWHAARALERITGKSHGDLNGDDSSSALAEWKKWYESEIKPKEEPKEEEHKDHDHKGEENKDHDDKKEEPKKEEPKKEETP